jgi:hypothetical protein
VGAAPFEVVMAGTLVEPLELQPQMEVWTSSAKPWAHHPEGITRCEKNPDVQALSD